MSDTFDISAPDSVARPYEQVGKETLRIRQQWEHYRTLFYEGEERIELLLERTGSFFKVLQETYLDDTILSVVRIIEEEKRHDKYVLSRSKDAVEDDGRENLASDLSSRLNEIRNLRPALKKRRDKLIAHRDKDALEGDVEFPDLSPGEIEEVLTHTEDFLNQIDAEYDDSEVAYEALVKTSGADALITSLKQAIDYVDAIQEGEVPIERFCNSEYYSA
jgi:hypothetical protein